MGRSGKKTKKGKRLARNKTAAKWHNATGLVFYTLLQDRREERKVGGRKKIEGEEGDEGEKVSARSRR